MFGALGGIMPLRLGGTATNGWTAAQHARFVADLVAVNRTAPLATMTIVKSGSTVTVDYAGRNGTGLAHAPDEIGTPATGGLTLRWTNQSFLDTYGSGELSPVVIRAVVAHRVAATGGKVTAVISGSPSVVFLRNFNSAGALEDGTFVVKLYGFVYDSNTCDVGDYAGDPDKRDSDTEGREPYAAGILAELQGLRGTAYTTTQGRLVDVENVALARIIAAAGPRTAEKLRANAVPGTSDERLDYWQRFLAVPQKLGEPKWRRRQKLATHYRTGEGPTLEAIETALAELLGDAFVSATWEEGASLSVPPVATYWPDVNPGPGQFSLGGGAWTSTRNHLLVLAQLPTGGSLGEFITLMTVDMPTLLDRMLPAWATFDWATSAGFYVATDDATGDGSLVDFDGV